MQIKSKISKRLFMRFPSVVDTPLTIICKVDGSILMQWYFLYHFYFEYDYNSLARAFFLTIFLIQAC